jgi:catechol 2,3-dioxygenase-like lactoylglutathione lyase family enzyme
VSIVNHVGLTVTDLEASQAFYVDVVGMTVQRRGFKTGGEWFDTLTENSGAIIDAVTVGSSEMSLQLVQYLEAGISEAMTGHNRVGNLHLCINVNDVEAKYQELKGRAELRATHIVNLPMAGYRSFYVRDPDGVPVEFLESPR